MKYTISLVLCIAFTISCKAQIIPIENTKEYEDEYEFAEGTYFKDVNGKLANFYGHWKSIDAPDGKQLDIYISEYVKTDIVGVIYDGIILRYEIKDSMGNIIYSTLGQSLDSRYVSRGGAFLNNKETYSIYYQGEESSCGQNGYLSFAIRIDDVDKMGFGYSVKDERNIFNCPDGVDQVMPFGETIIMERQ